MNKDQILKEVRFKAIRSSGAGGQHVNKVATKVILIFDLPNSEAFTAEEKIRLQENLKNRLNKEQELIVQSADSRSQTKNRETANKRLLMILEEGLKEKKVRKKTKPSPASKQKRLKAKRIQAEKKSSRKKPDQY